MPRLVALQISLYLLDNRYAAPPVIAIHELSASSLMARYSFSAAAQQFGGGGKAEKTQFFTKNTRTPWDRDPMGSRTPWGRGPHGVADPMRSDPVRSDPEYKQI